MVILFDSSTVSRRDSFRLLQSVIMDIKGLYVLAEFCGNI